MIKTDVVVCGGGTAGVVVAAELVAAGRRVLVLEAGPDYGSYASGRWPRELVDSATIPDTHDWGYKAGADLPGRDLPYERARVIAGCSAHNGCTVCWGTRAGYDAWGLPGWSADELLPLFERASERMRVRRFADDDLTPLHRGFIDAGLALGLPAVDDLDDLDGVPGVGSQPSNSPDGVRWNTAFAFLDAVRDRPELEIRDRALVDRLLVEGGRVVGVRAIVDGRAAGGGRRHRRARRRGLRDARGAAALRHRACRPSARAGHRGGRRQPRRRRQPPRPSQLPDRGCAPATGCSSAPLRLPPPAGGFPTSSPSSRSRRP